MSADGRTLVYVGYTPDGDDLFTLPLAAREVGTRRPGRRADEPAAPVEPAVDGAAPYRPWNTLAPRFWTPTLGTDSGETFAGAAVAGSDALGRHGYGAAVSWSSRAASGLAGGLHLQSLVADPVRLDADDTDPFRSGEARSTELNGGVLLPMRRVRRVQSVFGSVHVSTDTRPLRRLQSADRRAHQEARLAGRLHAARRRARTATRSAARTAGR